MEIGRIWQDGLGDPPIRAIDVFTQVLKDYPASDYRPEAMYRLAKLYDGIKEYAKALALYTELLEEFPKNKWADEATFARAKILDEQMKKHDEAAKEFDRLQKDYPDSPLSGQAGGQARQARGEQAGEEGEKYGKSRYGAIPYDTIRDKPLPPAGMFAQFAEQKLDAKSYDLKVEFLPVENRISVVGTMKVANGGKEKTEVLLMLGSGLKLSMLTVDGAAAKFEHGGEALKITMPAAWKTDGEVEVGFAYTGQYAEPSSAPLGGILRRGDAGGAGATTGPATTRAKPDPKLTVNMQMGLGEFGFGLSGAAWYPITIIGDVFDAHVVITTPANVEAVTNGELVKREKSTSAGVPSRYEFQTKLPILGFILRMGHTRCGRSRSGRYIITRISGRRMRTRRMRIWM